MKSIIRIILLNFTILLMMTSFTNAKPLKIHVSILPQKYFVERITGDLATVDVLVKPGKNPATYSPTPTQIESLSHADVYFRIGVPFENGFLHKIQAIAHDIKLVDCRKGIKLRQMKAHIHEEDYEKNEHAHTEEHQEHKDIHQDEHNHSGKDPHIWMNPMLVKKQADTILETLLEMDPDNALKYKKNHESFIHDLDALNNKLSTLLKPFKGEELFVFHPAFGYFAEAYGMKQVAVETMGKAPKGKELAAIIKLAKKKHTRIIFVQPQFDRNAAQKIAMAIKGHVVAINPLAYDYMNNMEAIANTVARSLNT